MEDKTCFNPCNYLLHLKNSRRMRCNKKHIFVFSAPLKHSSVQHCFCKEQFKILKSKTTTTTTSTLLPHREPASSLAYSISVNTQLRSVVQVPTSWTVNTHSLQRNFRLAFWPAQTHYLDLQLSDWWLWLSAHLCEWVCVYVCVHTLGFHPSYEAWLISRSQLCPSVRQHSRGCVAAALIQPKQNVRFTNPSMHWNWSEVWN